MKDSQLSYSPVDCEVLALKFALDASHHYVYGAKQVNIYTDCNSLEGLFKKQLGEIKNKRIRNIIEKLLCYNLVFHHIPGETNTIADCLSRLTRRIREAENFPLSDPILGSYAKIKKNANKSKFQADDPWVEKLADAAMMDPKYNDCTCGKWHRTK